MAPVPQLSCARPTSVVCRHPSWVYVPHCCPVPPRPPSFRADAAAGTSCSPPPPPPRLALHRSAAPRALLCGARNSLEGAVAVLVAGAGALLVVADRLLVVPEARRRARGARGSTPLSLLVALGSHEIWTPEWVSRAMATPLAPEPALPSPTPVASPLLCRACFPSPISATLRLEWVGNCGV